MSAATTSEGRALAGLHDAFRLLASAADGGEFVEDEGLLIVVTGGDAHACNQAFVTEPLRSPEAGIEAAVSFFDDRGLPFLMQIPRGLDPASAAAAVGLGLTMLDEAPFMILEPLPHVRAAPRATELEVRPVSTEPELSQNVGVAARAFGMDEAAMARLVSPNLVSEDRIRLFTGFVDGEAVATSCVHVADAAAGIFSVATLEEHRRRGIGEAMTARALGHAADAGCDLAFLQSSNLGLPIYERMGFRTIGAHAVYARQP